MSAASQEQEQPTPLRFDFNKAVEAARRDFGDKLQGITFINLDAPDVEAQMERFYAGLSDKGREELGNRRRENSDFLTKDASPTVWRTTDGQGLLLAYGSRTHLSEAEKIHYAPDDPAKLLHYTFSHELGHLVVKGADVYGNYAEHAADTFAILRGLQSRFLDRKDVKQIADGRDMLGWLNADVTHITSMSLDALLINPKHADFTCLTPKQTAEISAKHADIFALDGINASTMRSVLPRWGLTLAQMRGDSMEALGALVLAADKKSLPFYFAARIILTVQARKESGDPLLADTHFGGEKWEKVFAAIDKKAHGRDIGAARAVTQEDLKPQTAIQKLASKLKPLSI